MNNKIFDKFILSVYGSQGLGLYFAQLCPTLPNRIGCLLLSRRDDTSLAPDEIGGIQRKSGPTPTGVECVETVIVLRLARRSLKKSSGLPSNRMKMPSLRDSRFAFDVERLDKCQPFGLRFP